jgi:hypothetical protein
MPRCACPKMVVIALVAASINLSACRERPKSRLESSQAQLAQAELDLEQKCVDRWLEERELDPYGSPQGTVYAGGDPLFDERTADDDAGPALRVFQSGSHAREQSRLSVVYAKHAAVREACTPRDASARR